MNGHGDWHYVNDDCRCKVCTEAHTKNCYRMRMERVARLRAGEVDVPHGKESTYGNWGCRCRACTDAWAAACLARKHRRLARLAAGEGE